MGSCLENAFSGSFQCPRGPESEIVLSYCEEVGGVEGWWCQMPSLRHKGLFLQIGVNWGMEHD